jgi:hypothetical protein
MLGGGFAKQCQDDKEKQATAAREETVRPEEEKKTYTKPAFNLGFNKAQLAQVQHAAEEPKVE